MTVANIIFKVYHIVFNTTLLCLYCICVSTKFESNVNIERVLLHCGYKFMTSIFLFKIPVSFFTYWHVVCGSFRTISSRSSSSKNIFVMAVTYSVLKVPLNPNQPTNLVTAVCSKRLEKTILASRNDLIQSPRVTSVSQADRIKCERVITSCDLMKLREFCKDCKDVWKCYAPYVLLVMSSVPNIRWWKTII